MKTEYLTKTALDAVRDIFADTTAEIRTQIEALEDIEDLCSQNIDALKEQLRRTAKDEGGAE